jgi:hypothetical protein
MNAHEIMQEAAYQGIELSQEDAAYVAEQAEALETDAFDAFVDALDDGAIDPVWVETGEAVAVEDFDDGDYYDEYDYEPEPAHPSREEMFQHLETEMADLRERASAHLGAPKISQGQQDVAFMKFDNLVAADEQGFSNNEQVRARDLMVFDGVSPEDAFAVIQKERREQERKFGEELQQQKAELAEYLGYEPSPGDVAKVMARLEDDLPEG